MSKVRSGNQLMPRACHNIYIQSLSLSLSFLCLSVSIFVCPFLFLTLSLAFFLSLSLYLSLSLTLSFSHTLSLSLSLFISLSFSYLFLSLYQYICFSFIFIYVSLLPIFIHYIQYVFFYGDKSICSFYPLKIVQDKSNLSQNLRLVRKFDKIHLEYHKSYVNISIDYLHTGWSKKKFMM